MTALQTDRSSDADAAASAISRTQAVLGMRDVAVAPGP